jgi:hypothetical protein
VVQAEEDRGHGVRDGQYAAGRDGLRGRPRLRFSARVRPVRRPLRCVLPARGSRYEPLNFTQKNKEDDYFCFYFTWGGGDLYYEALCIAVYLYEKKQGDLVSLPAPLAYFFTPPWRGFLSPVLRDF